ncbi:MAG: hypothetical protein ACTIKR_17910 [Advenella sp.]|uniref:hypothetical protein n=1 Tax=unclassified Advenella TaxID=2685285 RepID=UPI001866D75C|nr:hypothetical protein [Advenella sp. FME57]
MKKMLVVVGMLMIFLSGCVAHDRHSGYRDGYRYKGPKYERKYNHHKKYKSHRSYHRSRACSPGHDKQGRC